MGWRTPAATSRPLRGGAIFPSSAFAPAAAPKFIEEGNVWTLELPRGFLSFALEKDLRFDPAFLRHLPLIGEALERFQPDLIHITGPSEVGMLGAGLAHRLRAAAGRQLAHQRARVRWRGARSGFCACCPERNRLPTEQKIEDWTMAVAPDFTRWPGALRAQPRASARCWSGRQAACYLMPRGVDAELFHPGKRRRSPDDRQFVLGFVGRLSVEKNITLLAQVQQELERTGHTELPLSHRRPRQRGGLAARAIAARRVYRSAAWGRAGRSLRQHGPLRLPLAHRHLRQCCAGGAGQRRSGDCHSRRRPATIVRDGETGRIVPDAEFAAAIAGVLADPARHAAMRQAARTYALTMSWDSVFEGRLRGL
jgi:phosphatidylinositol alpha 1,6-mannosyltransferase